MYRGRPLVVFALIILNACSTLRTGYDYDPAYPFADLKTYNWAPDAKPSSGDPVIDTDTLLDQRVREAVERELASKGYKKETIRQPDFWVAYHISVRSRAEMSLLDPFYGYYGWGGWGMGGYYPGPYASGYMREYDEGTLTLDFTNPANHKLIWRGTGRDYMNLDDSPQEKARYIERSVRAMLKKFPPVSG